MHERGKSDSPVVPAKLPNNTGLPVTLTRNADRALYTAKANGRNRVETFTAETNNRDALTATTLPDAPTARALTTRPPRAENHAAGTTRQVRGDARGERPDIGQIIESGAPEDPRT